MERNHRCLNEFVRQFINESHSDWDDWLPYYAFCYNTTPHSNFLYTPFELIFGRTAKLPNNISKPTEIEPIYNYDEYYSELKQKLQFSAMKTKQIMDRIKRKRIEKQEKTSKPIEIKVHDKVMLENENRTKFDKIYKGPYEVIKIDHPNVTLVDTETKQEKIVHKNRIIKS